MARQRSIHVGALNVTLLEHSPRRYIELFQELRRNRLTFRYYGERHAMLAHLSRGDGNLSHHGMQGLITTFLEIDTQEEWLNTQTGKPAEGDDLAAVQFPDHLKPGLRSFRFVFFPEEHRFFFETRNAQGKTISPGSMRNILEGLLNQDAIAEHLGPSDITVEPEHEALEAIFRMHRLQRLIVHITRPNADDQDDVESEVLERLRRQNARSHTEELKSADNDGLQPDDEYRTLARVAASNGFVEAHGKDHENRPDFESTKDHPMIESIQYDPETETASGVLRNGARKMLQRILRR